MNLEALESQHADQLVPYTTQLLRDQVARGDFFFCASERQRDYWIGMLAGAGRVTSAAYRADPDLRQLDRRRAVRHSGRAAACAPRRAFAASSTGSATDDPLLHLERRALGLVRAGAVHPRDRHRARPRCRTSAPTSWACATRAPTSSRARRRSAIALAEQLGLRDTHVFFNDWTPYDDAPERLSRRHGRRQLPPRAPRDALLVPHAHPGLHLGLAADRLQRRRRARRPRAQRAARHHGRPRAMSRPRPRRSCASRATTRCAGRRATISTALAHRHTWSTALAAARRLARAAVAQRRGDGSRRVRARRPHRSAARVAQGARAAAAAPARARPGQARAPARGRRASATVEPSVIRQLSELRGFGYLFRNFLSRDLSSRYKGSLLGVVWSLMNPLVMMAIYTVVFSVIFPSQAARLRDPAARRVPAVLLLPDAPSSLGVPTLVANAGLIKKVYFPRELLPLSMTAASFVNFLFTMVLLLPAAAYAREGVNGWALLTLIPVARELLPGHRGPRDAARGAQRLLPRRRVPQRHHPDGALLPHADRLHARSSSSSRARRVELWIGAQPADAVHGGLPHGHLLQGRCRSRSRSPSAPSSASAAS